jgi:hypothetical protein
MPSAAVAYFTGPQVVARIALRDRLSAAENAT